MFMLQSFTFYGFLKLIKLTNFNSLIFLHHPFLSKTMINFNTVLLKHRLSLPSYNVIAF